MAPYCLLGALAMGEWEATEGAPTGPAVWLGDEQTYNFALYSSTVPRGVEPPLYLSDDGRPTAMAYLRKPALFAGWAGRSARGARPP